MTSEKRLQKFHTNYMSLPRSRRVTRHQYRNSAVIFQTSFLVTRRNSILRCACHACEFNKSTELIFVEHEKEKKRKYQQRVIDVEIESFTPLDFGTQETFSEQPSGQTFPKERRVLCQCHILAQNTQIFWNSKISPHMCTRVQNPFSQECWLFRWFLC